MQNHVPAAQKANQQEVDNFVLSHDHLGHLFFDAGAGVAQAGHHGGVVGRERGRWRAVERGDIGFVNSLFQSWDRSGHSLGFLVRCTSRGEKNAL